MGHGGLSGLPQEGGDIWGQAPPKKKQDKVKGS